MVVRDEGAAAAEFHRRATDHIEPCGLLQVAQANIIDMKEDISLLFKRVDRLPPWMVFLFSATTAALAASITAIYFLVTIIRGA